MTPQEQHTALTAALQDTRSGEMGAAALSQMAQHQALLLQALPERYRDVLMQLLDRLESSALFSEESCSFSQKELLDSLQLWLDKAALQLQKT